MRRISPIDTRRHFTSAIMQLAYDVFCQFMLIDILHANALYLPINVFTVYVICRPSITRTYAVRICAMDPMTLSFLNVRYLSDQIILIVQFAGILICEMDEINLWHRNQWPIIIIVLNNSFVQCPINLSRNSNKIVSK